VAPDEGELRWAGEGAEEVLGEVFRWALERRVRAAAVDDDEADSIVVALYECRSI
jgi:hypothetical protein